MEIDLYLDPFVRLLEEVAPIGQLRAIEKGASGDELWRKIEESGYIDAFVPDAEGNPMLPASAAPALFGALGRRLVPLPVAETMIARALIASAGGEVPAGAIALAIAHPEADGWRTGSTEGITHAEHALVELEGGLTLVAISGSPEVAIEPTEGGAGILRSTTATTMPFRFSGPPAGLRPIIAAIRAAMIAGAADEVGRLTISYAGTRAQFGKPIGRYQAVQQQLAELAEQIVMARMAAQIGFASGLVPTLEATAITKQVASVAAHRVAAIAHAVHGAIGITAEFDLQLYTRSLHRWRLSEGTESYWAGRLGGACLSSGQSVLDFIRSV
ncbi:acyl-CoA dehydrogenase family protein [Sphingomonas sp.]|uniref:acyl-CoA dehydrogenase family protein n=1 Tax=Sphingomonas sp. TaxID=28214 RepID=UPI003B00EC2B